MEKMQIVQKPKEKILVVAIDWKHERRMWSSAEIINEMKELVLACEGEVAGEFICRVDKPSANNLIGKGKAEEIKFLVDTLDHVDIVIFSEDLKGSQQRNLEDFLSRRVMDRTRLILDIFARRATTREGKTQVELAQLQYMLPRLIGHGVEMSRLGGGIGTSGPGESKLELDRRRIDQRIIKLKRELEHIVSSREVTRGRRQENKIPVISLVGYTNAGKSTLMNGLTDANQITKDGLFTTLSSLSRQIVLANQQQIIISDTVGFMRDLPHGLIESFKATLEEVKQADILLHVVDVSHPHFPKLVDAVDKVLVQLQVKDKPMIVVLNKIDKLSDQTFLADLEKTFPQAVSISALKKENLVELIHMITQILEKGMCKVKVFIPLNRQDLMHLLFEQSDVISKDYQATGCYLECHLSAVLAEKLKDFIVVSD